MQFNLRELPSDLQHRYTKLSQDYKNFTEDLREYQLSKIPRYVSIPQWCSENEIVASYDEMKEMADIAREKSLRYVKPIKMGSTPIGTLFCFYEELVEAAFEELTNPDEDEGEI